MVFGFTTKSTTKEVKVTKSISGKTVKKSAQAEEAAAILKKMQEKDDAGECPFC